MMMETHCQFDFICGFEFDFIIKNVIHEHDCNKCYFHWRCSSSCLDSA